MSAAATRILVAGAGYGGLTCALRLGRLLRERIEAGEVEVVLVDRNPYHLLETRLHEAAARGVEVTIPIAKLLTRRPVRFVQAEISGIDAVHHAVVTPGGRIAWDILVLALGSRSLDFGIPGIGHHAFELKTLEDARSLKEHLEARFAEAAREPDPARRRWLRRIIVGGGGLTGVEAATELAERVRQLTGSELGTADGGEILLVEAAARVLPAHDDPTAGKTADILHRAGIRVLAGTRIEEVGAEHVRLSTGELLRSGTVLWTAGVRASEVLERSGLAVAQHGRVLVDPTLRVRHLADVYAIGDAALSLDPRTREPVPMAAQFALQQGRLVADNIVARLAGTRERAYRPRVLGEVISLGRHLAVGWLALGWGGRVRMAGFLASLLKRAIAERHLASLWRESRRWARPEHPADAPHGDPEPAPASGPSVGEVVRVLQAGTTRGGAIDTASARGPAVVVRLHGPGCPGCRRWTERELDPLREATAAWGGRVVLVDPDGLRRSGLSAWLAVADEWGEVFHTAAVGEDHSFPDTSELADWVRFVAVQCPECEGPEGAWRGGPPVVREFKGASP